MTWKKNQEIPSRKNKSGLMGGWVKTEPMGTWLTIVHHLSFHLFFNLWTHLNCIMASWAPQPVLQDILSTIHASIDMNVTIQRNTSQVSAFFCRHRATLIVDPETEQLHSTTRLYRLFGVYSFHDAPRRRTVSDDCWISSKAQRSTYFSTFPVHRTWPRGPSFVSTLLMKGSITGLKSVFSKPM